MLTRILAAVRACAWAFFQFSHNALFDSIGKTGVNHTTYDGPNEGEFAADLKVFNLGVFDIERMRCGHPVVIGFDAHVYFGELPGATALLFMTIVVDFLGDGFAVRDAWLGKLQLNAEVLFGFGAHYVEVHFTLALNNGLFEFDTLFDEQCRLLPECCAAHWPSFTLGLGRRQYGHSDAGRREMNALNFDFRAFGVEGLVGMRAFEFDGAAYVASAEFD